MIKTLIIALLITTAIIFLLPLVILIVLNETVTWESYKKTIEVLKELGVKK